MPPPLKLVLELQKLWRELPKRLLTGPATQIPKTLYHYTNAEGLLGIVDSGTVWATHSAYLNDASELQYAIGLMKEVVEKATADAKENSWKWLCRYAICVNAVREGRHAVIQAHGESPDSVGSAQDTEETHFVACFSKEGDRLSQWRGYGKSIGGYALGFPFEHLRAIQKRINDSQVGKTYHELNPLIEVGFGRCWYNPEEQKSLLADAFNRVLRHLKKPDPAPFSSLGRDDFLTRLTHPVSWLPGVLNAIPRIVSPYLKSPDFKEEQEWRLVVRVRRPPTGVRVRVGHDRTRPEDDIRMDEIATVHFRKGEYSLVPHIVLPLVLNAELPLSKVVVGPTPLPENARAAAMQFLRKKHKIVCEGRNIVNSRIPFRRV